MSIRSRLGGGCGGERVFTSPGSKLFKALKMSTDTLDYVLSASIGLRTEDILTFVSSQ